MKYRLFAIILAIGLPILLIKYLVDTVFLSWRILILLILSLFFLFAVLRLEVKRTAKIILATVVVIVSGIVITSVYSSVKEEKQLVERRLVAEEQEEEHKKKDQEEKNRTQEEKKRQLESKKYDVKQEIRKYSFLSQKEIEKFNERIEMLNEISEIDKIKEEAKKLNQENKMKSLEEKQTSSASVNSSNDTNTASSGTNKTFKTPDYSIGDVGIKGNKRSRIYHLPGQRDYDKIKPENIIYFRSEAEAQAAGYRVAKR